MPWEAPRAFTTQTTCTSNRGEEGASPASERHGVSQHFFYKAAPPRHKLAMTPHPWRFLLRVHSTALNIWSQSTQTSLLADYGLDKSWGGLEACLFLSACADYTRKITFRKAIQNSHIFAKTAYIWAVLIPVSCAITKQKLKGDQAKDTNSALKGQALLMLQKILSPARDPTDSCGIFWQKRKGKKLHNLPGRENVTRRP